MILSVPFPGSSSKKTGQTKGENVSLWEKNSSCDGQQTEENIVQEPVQAASAKPAQDYEKELEDRISQLLKSVEGVGKVDLMVVLSSSGEKVFRTVKKADGLKRTGGDARKDYYEHMFMYGEHGIQGAAWFKLYKTDIIRKNSIEFPKLRKSEDDVFVARYVNCIDSFYMTGDVLCRYYVNSVSYTHLTLPTIRLV